MNESMLVKSLFLLLACCFPLVLLVPLPPREVNEEDNDAYLKSRHAKAPDLKIKDAEDWQRIAEEGMKKADEMFGNPKKQNAHMHSSSTARSNGQQLQQDDPMEKEDPNHLPGVVLEGDGTLNQGYREEMLLGPDHSAAHSSPEQQRVLLKSIFMRMDVNSDDLIDVDELTNWILDNVRRHMQSAQAEGEAEFRRLDKNKDNKLEWHEYETAHLRAVLAKGSDSFVPHKASASFVNVHHSEKEGNHGKNEADDHGDHLAALRMRWMRADENGDDLLTLSEFSSFHHPEQHPGQLSALSNQLMASFDLDQDGKIMDWEFEAHTDHLPEDVRAKGPGSVMQYTNELRAERKHQFALADVDQNGYLTIEEVNNFLDPQNEQHARHEAEDIIQLADVDTDGELSLTEMLEKAPELMGPGRRLCDPAEALHDLDEL